MLTSIYNGGGDLGAGRYGQLWDGVILHTLTWTNEAGDEVLKIFGGYLCSSSRA